jgi:hypothetical protein
MPLALLAKIASDPAGFIVKLSRGLYVSSIGSIAFLWYTGWRRERVPQHSGIFPFPGLSKLQAQFSPSLADSPIPTGGPTDSQSVKAGLPPNPGLNPPGSGNSSGGKHENFDPLRYAARLHTAQKIANQFRLHITSGHRTPQHNAQVGGVPGSLHVDGLAFDFVGAAQDMQRAYTWANSQPQVFSEVLVHNVGSGLHLHLAFWPTAGL